MFNLFTYGTLMCDDIMAEVSGPDCVLNPCKVTLKGYKRRKISDENFPALVINPTGSVEGVLYPDLPDSALKRLDIYEGDMYFRETVAVEREDGKTLKATAYIIKPEHEKDLGPDDWDFGEFLRKEKEDFMKQIWDI